MPYAFSYKKKHLATLRPYHREHYTRKQQQRLRFVSFAQARREREKERAAANIQTTLTHTNAEKNTRDCLHT